MAVEEIRLSSRPTPLRFFYQRNHEFVEVICRTVICVERHVDRVSVGGTVDVFRNRNSTEGHVLDGSARGKGSSARGNGDNPVTLAFRKAPQNRVGSGERCYVDGRIGKMILLRSVEHLLIDCVVSYWHLFLLSIRIAITGYAMIWPKAPRSVSALDKWNLALPGHSPSHKCRQVHPKTYQ
ncbi:MAG: hypothetical protein A4E63_01665 [Syntrophorhabdus sp. PtaU1.Bin050]|nr:MAG: hypothetical protein A4E63_01665 [Syntrophorhabdus sp. PtaU1.Bin050]